MILYRPVGIIELGLIYDSGMKAFPPRLPEQPIFYPVLNLEYAEQIARDWNTKFDNQAGFVTRFSVEDAFIQQFPIQVVGGKTHQELWVPAEQLHEFNQKIEGTILLETAFFGSKFHGFSSESAMDQWQAMHKVWISTPSELEAEVLRNHKTVFLHFPFWCAWLRNEKENDELLDVLCRIWEQHRRPIKLLKLSQLMN